MDIIGLFQDKINGVLSTFDRMIIKGHLQAFYNHRNRMFYLYSENVLLKDYSKYAQKITDRIKIGAKELAESLDRPYIYLKSSKKSKEEIAKTLLKQKSVEEGLICVLQATEPCISTDIIKNKDTFKLELQMRERQCTYLYFYYLDKEFGFMHAKLQTWVPYTFQIYINGREYLSKQLDKAGISYKMYDNSFTYISDVEKAQEIANKIESRDLSDMFNYFAKKINPQLSRISEIFKTGYYWCLDQCEYATDIMFKSREDLTNIYPDLVGHALTSFKAEDVMVFLGRKMTGAFLGEVVSNIKKRPEGIRIKHRMKSNSIKMYDKCSVLRIEVTINDPSEFKIYKEVTRKGEKVKEWVPMGKSISNLYRYAQVSFAANKRYIMALANAGFRQENIKEIEKASSKVTGSKNKKVSGFNLLSKETSDIFTCVMSASNFINGLTNESIRKALFGKTSQDKKIRNKVTRILAKLRTHKIIKKIPHSFRYSITKFGIKIITGVLQIKKIELPKRLSINYSES
jgi:hypothetical protein